MRQVHNWEMSPLTIETSCLLVVNCEIAAQLASLQQKKIRYAVDRETIS